MARGEEANEMGGYFIVNGNEKLLRLTISPRKHYVSGVLDFMFDVVTH